MAYSYPAMVAWNPGTNTIVKNTVFQVYAPTDTTYTSPLAITDNQGNTLGNLNSGSQGVFPNFRQAQYATVVVSDVNTHTYNWTVPCSQLNPVTPWAANTYYTAGQPVVSPNGDTVTANVNHTSTSTYDSTKWTSAAANSSSQLRTTLDGTYAPLTHASRHAQGGADALDPYFGMRRTTDIRTKGAVAGTTNSSAAFAAALTDAKNSSAALPFSVASDPHSTVVVDIPAGVWTVAQVNAMIGSEAMAAKSVGLKVRGAGLGLTSVIFNPATGGALNTNDYWLSIQFEGIDFYATVAGCTFMFSNTTHNAQRYSFSHCSFTNFKYVIDLQGNNNNSEFIFLYCHATGIASKETDKSAGAFFHIGASNTSDQFLNYWFYGCTHWSSSAPYIDAAMGGSFHIFGLDCSDWGAALTGTSANPAMFNLRGSSHSYGVTSFEASGVRVEGKSNYAALLYSEWQFGSVTFRNVDFTSQIPTYTYVNLCTFNLTSYTTTAYLFQGCRLPGPVTVIGDSNSWREVPTIKFDSCEFLHQSSPSSMVTYSNASVNSFFKPRVQFVNCTNEGANRSGFEAAGYSIWDCTIGATTLTGEVTKREIHCRQGGGTDVVTLVLPIGALITDVEVMAPASSYSQTTTATWTWATTDATPVTIASATVSNPSLGFRQATALTVPFYCGTAAQAKITMKATSLTGRSDTALIIVKGYW